MVNHCWRGLACASLLFSVLPSSVGAQTENRIFRIGAASIGGSFFEIGFYREKGYAVERLPRAEEPKGMPK
jgi:hypothetical protein